MAKWVTSIACVVGVCLFGAGLLYGVLTVGVPTPDAAPSVAARQARDFHWAMIGMAGGLVILAVGLVLLAIVAIRGLARRRGGGG